MEAQHCGRALVFVSIVMYSAVPVFSQGLDFLQNNQAAVRTDGDIYDDNFMDDRDTGSYSDLDNSMSLHESWFPRTHHFETRRRFLTSKRGWDIIDKIWQPQFPKRAWELVDRVWKIPSLRKKYLRYLNKSKRSLENAVDIPVQPQRRQAMNSPTNDLIPDFDEANARESVSRKQLKELVDNAWSILKVIKGLIGRCCEPGQNSPDCACDL